MAQNTGTLVTAPIRPNDSLDPIASAHADEIKGGLHSKTTLAERDAIILARREWGMTCVVHSDSTPANNGKYVLTKGLSSTDLIDNSNWLNIETITGEKTLYVDATVGNDITARKGNILYKYKTADAAINAASTGDTIIFYNNAYTPTISLLPVNKSLTYILISSTLNVTVSSNPTSGFELRIYGIGNSYVSQNNVNGNLSILSNGGRLILHNIDVYDVKTSNTSGIGTIRSKDNTTGAYIRVSNVNFYTKALPVFLANIVNDDAVFTNTTFNPYPSSTSQNNIVIAYSSKVVFDNCRFKGYSSSYFTSSWEYGGLLNIGAFSNQGANVTIKNCEFEDLGTFTGLVINDSTHTIRFEGIIRFKSGTATSSILKTAIAGGNHANQNISLAGDVYYNKPITLNSGGDAVTWVKDSNTGFNLSVATQAEEEAGIVNNKVSSPQGRTYWWNAKKLAAEVVAGVWRFTNGIEVNGVKLLDGSTYRNVLTRTVANIIDFGGTGWVSINFINPIKNLIHANDTPAIITANPDGTFQPGPIIKPLTISHPSIIAILQDDGNWDGYIMNPTGIAALIPYSDYTEQGVYYYDEATSWEYKWQENDVVTRRYINNILLRATYNNNDFTATEADRVTYTIAANTLRSNRTIKIKFTGRLYIATEDRIFRFRIGTTDWITFSDTYLTGAWVMTVELIYLTNSAIAIVAKLEVNDIIKQNVIQAAVSTTVNNTIALRTSSTTDNTIRLYRSNIELL